MGITKLSKSGFKSSSYEKYNDFLAGNTAFNPGSYESIATVTVGSGGSATVSFTSIPATYTHLQIRGIARSTNAGTGASSILVRFNSDNATNYSWHYLTGNGSAVSAGAGASQSSAINGITADAGYTSNTFSASVIDILDYANSNKYKTLRSLSGADGNGYGEIYMWSGNWRSTSAVTSITLSLSTTFAQYSQFALYGIKGS